VENGNHKKSRWYYGIILVVEFSDKEERLYHQALEWLSSTLCTTPAVMAKQTTDFVINQYTRVVVNENIHTVNLTSKEFDLLYFLYSHRGQVFSKEQLYENVWGYDDIPASSNLTSFIRKLRKKVEPDPDNPIYIITVWGVGYKFSEEKP
jgi:DNA-binding response OmpR family regulator